MRITQIICLALPWMLLQAGAQSIETNKPIHLLSLDDCLTMALQRNYDIQIQRLAPQIARSALDASYGLYDPVFRATAVRTYNVNEGGFAVGTVQDPPSERQSDTFAPGLGGTLPTGLTYDLNWDINHNTGKTGGGPFDFYDGQAAITL